MDLVVIILGVLGLGAIIVAAYVFIVAARNYVSDDHKKQNLNEIRTSQRHQATRSSTDRRSGKTVAFPLTVNGVRVPQDRRRQPDRRRAA